MGLRDRQRPQWAWQRGKKAAVPQEQYRGLERCSAQPRQKPALRAELGAALGATTGQQLATLLGGHAGTETVRAGAADFAGLVGTLHISSGAGFPTPGLWTSNKAAQDSAARS